MCAACVAQGIGYVGTAVGGLQVMAYRAKSKTKAKARRTAAPPAPADAVPVTVTDEVPAGAANAP